VKLITPFGAEVKNEWSHASTPPIPNGVDGKNFTFFFNTT
jgi:hypothetical protein